MNNKLNSGAEESNLGRDMADRINLPNVKAQRWEGLAPKAGSAADVTSPDIRCSAWLGSVVLGSGSSEPQNQPAQFDHTDDIFSKSALIPSNIGRIAPKYSEGANSGISKSFNVLFA